MWYLTTQLKPRSASEQHEKMAQGHCPQTLTGAYAPRTLRAGVLKKMTSQPTFFAACSSPKYTQFTLAF